MSKRKVKRVVLGEGHIWFCTLGRSIGVMRKTWPSELIALKGYGYYSDTTRIRLVAEVLLAKRRKGK